MSIAPTDIDLILAAAVEISSPRERAEYVARMCGENAELRGRIEELLTAHFRAGDFLDRPPATVLLRDGEDIQAGPGSIIGPYKLLQQIGDGGMGVVFMAEQTRPIQRTVALKIIKPGMDTRQVIARFEAERQALAMMDHPNIARVLDAGTTASEKGDGSLLPERPEGSFAQKTPVPFFGGRPYFVMELVKGIPITRYCDEHKLSIRERLELVRPVCEAVQHAHQKGIIHRDLKPSNVLVAEYDSRPVPKVIDFGVAKATAQRLTERTVFTEFGQVIGTVEYMSPEQAKFNQLDIDTRSDIYSLGVLLYELLTGATPFDRERLRSAAFDEVLRIIREEEPPRPSTRLSTSSTLPAIAANRHTEPDKLSRKVRGELDWIVMKCLEKERGRRYETANGLLRDIERYLSDEPVLACPPSAVYRFRKFARRNKLGIAAASAAVAVLLLLIAGLAVSNRLIAAQRAQAEFERQRAEESLLKARVAIRDVLFEAALGRGEWGHLPNSVREKFAEKTTNFYSSLINEGSTNPSLQYETAIGFRSLALLQLSLMDHQKAEGFARQAIAILDPLARDFPDKYEYRNQQAYTYYVLGLSLNRQGRNDEAKTTLSKSFEMYAALITPRPDQLPVREEMTICFLALIPRCQTEESEQLTKRHIELNATHPDLKDNRAELIESYRTLATKLSGFRQWGAAFFAANFGVQAAEKFVRELPQSADARNGLGLCLRTRGSTHRELGRNEESERDFNQAVQIFNELRADYPDETKYKTQLAYCFKGLGTLKQQQQKSKEAEAYYRRAMEADPSDPVAMNYLGAVLWNSRRFEEATSMYRDAVNLAPENVGYRFNLARALKDDNKHAEAENEYREILRRTPRDSAALRELAEVLYRLDKIGDAAELYLSIVKMIPNDANARASLATTLHTLGRETEAEAEWQKALELPEAKQADWLNTWAWNLATTRDLKWRDASRAVKFGEKATELLPTDGNIWNTVGVARYRAGAWQPAIDALAKSMELRNGGDAADWFFLAMAHWQLDHKTDARQWYEKAVESTDKALIYRELLDFRAEAAEVLMPAYEEEVARARAEIEREPTSSVHYHSLGAALEKQGKYDDARGAFQKSIELGPEDATAYVSLVKLTTIQGNSEEAGATLRKLLELQPKNADTLESLATKRVVNEATGHAYQRIEIPMSWQDARKCCELMGGHLATVASNEENDFLYNHFARDHVCWLGATDEQHEGQWTWVTGEPWKYSNWFDGEPNNVQGAEHCLCIGGMPSVMVDGVTYYFNFMSMWADMGASGNYHDVTITFPLCEWDESGSKQGEAVQPEPPADAEDQP